MISRLKGIFSKKSHGIGIEVAPERLNLVQLRQQGQVYKLVNYRSVEVPEGIFEEGQIVDSPGLAELIQETLAETKIKATKVATAVPMREAIIRIIPIPAELDDNELREMVLNHEAGLYLPYPREEVDLDYQKLGFFQDEDGIEKVQVLLVATRREVTDSYLDTFTQAGLYVDVLEINSFALIRTIREQLRQFGSNEAAVLVDIEFDSTEIAIIVDGVPQFSRTVPIGTYQLQSALSRAMNLPVSRNTELLQEMTIPETPADGIRTGATGINPGMAALLRVLGELADELRRSIDFYLNQSENLEVAQLLLAGPGGGIGQLDDFFTQRLSLPTTKLDPVAALSLEMEEEIPEIQRPGLGIVLGLGMREV
ncbi:MAG: pilus assembly protein PilM [Oscillatoria sp. PMC 1051.18]|uniref:type IV pilus assembly protein PilM n=1 Tax=Oscillatoria salina TaxID=331517 RepID=UPI0013BBDCD3|nr:type IV pilus biogenesis protein PilM [Oscillatoria salina]MBZ8181170.1 pilus assembly protein PilM [Oscillatoria salina IIICB1]MEC4891940.1 pilus assembly protein PilM [Oscillatoria sp. PMC 1050.18]MEC5028566.1 pilus assembly protein PilM [Oscillatoria sp. PMC 1051.18]NET88869.1 pilus assembly protein PilM [Kamptonema sp. SIO1D9]